MKNVAYNYKYGQEPYWIGPWITSAVRDPATGLWTFTPVLGEEELSDPGLEGTYTAGLCAAFSKGGSPTVAESADVHGGSKAQAFTATAQWDAIRNDYAPSAGWKQFSSWYKRTAGTAGNNFASIYQGTTLSKSAALTAADWTQVIVTVRVANATCSFTPAQSHLATPFDSIITDDNSVKPITLSSLLAIRNMGRSTIASWGAPVVVPAGHHGGVVGWATVDGLNMICARHNRINVVLEKIVNGTPTVLVNSAAAYSDSLLPTVVREDATHFHVKYNGVQVGATQEIADAGIIGNTYFGLFNSGAGTVGTPVYT